MHGVTVKGDKGDKGNASKHLFNAYCVPGTPPNTSLD